MVQNWQQLAFLDDHFQATKRNLLQFFQKLYRKNELKRKFCNKSVELKSLVKVTDQLFQREVIEFDRLLNVMLIQQTLHNSQICPIGARAFVSALYYKKGQFLELPFEILWVKVPVAFKFKCFFIEF